LTGGTPVGYALCDEVMDKWSWKDADFLPDFEKIKR
jgi:hypothetical protein